MADFTNQIPEHIQKAQDDVSHKAMQAIHPGCPSKKFNIFLKPDRVIAKCFHCNKQVAQVILPLTEEELAKQGAKQ